MALAGKPLPIAAPVPAAASAHPAKVAQARRARPKTASHQAKTRHAQGNSARAHVTQTAPASPAMGYLGLLEALVLAPVGLG
jgi:hypothetical protein